MHILSEVMLKLFGKVPCKHRIFFEVLFELIEALPVLVDISIKFVLEDGILLLKVLDYLHLFELYLKFITHLLIYMNHF